jgi:Uma2 family endonuclease
MTPARKPAAPLVTEAEYLRAERLAEDRHVFLDGHVRAMAGESLNHGKASVNLVVLVGSQLKGTPCFALTKDTKVRSGPPGPWPSRRTKGLYSYPDIVVVCGEPEFLDEKTDVLLNPTVVVEVLSPSTEAFDRGEKFDRLAVWNPSLTDYLLVSQDRPWIDHFTRQPDAAWRLTRHHGLEAVCALPGVGLRLALAEVYDRVVFPDPDADDAPTPPEE